MKTLKLIQTLKRSINPKTGQGFTYRDIGGILGVSKQAVSQQIKRDDSLCCGCLRPLRKIKGEL